MNLLESAVVAQFVQIYGEFSLAAHVQEPVVSLAGSQQLETLADGFADSGARDILGFG